MRNMEKVGVHMSLVVLLIMSIACTPKQEYKLVWSDEFDYTGLPDSTLWDYDTEGNAHGWGNNEDQYYTVARKENAWVKNGLLHVTAVNETYHDKAYTSVRLISKADWKYGRIEVRAKVPEAKGTWAAIWMMPGGWSFNDGGWPGIGEIDIMEHVGHEAGVIHASAHSKDYQWQKGTQKTGTINIDDATKAFHTYVLEWTPEVLKCYVDDQLYFTYQNEGLGEDKWPYNKPFYLILNVAVGGAWGSVQGIDAEAFPQTMEVDYVRVYQREE
ncbi:Glycosyl hydrolases family 16 [Saccharicrinis carchari]|uniref:Glycosyl hydrolases family 16 n=1 Tax=Saccharicrinis carchari TaxID=1168039 RepID=A0A521B9L7_SACCC|nr:glycoside hydrolase family 16 protein [Saccharicrinis carchari]SMO43788.1 Glycosyl hydrolases family 16 [Saccharicrinis carchari]